MFNEQLRELSRAVALNDFDGATIILDLMSRDRGGDVRIQIELGRSDAAIIRARDCRPKIVKVA